jgi:putative redox protein
MPMTIRASVDPEINRLEVTTTRGMTVRIAGDPPEGDASAPGAREMVLAALAGCTSMDIASILRKKRQRIATYEVEVSATSAEQPPRVFVDITVVHRVTGAVEPEALRRSIELSATRYCPVNAMLSKGTNIEHRYRLTDASGHVSEALVAATGPAGTRVA